MFVQLKSNFTNEEFYSTNGRIFYLVLKVWFNYLSGKILGARAFNVALAFNVEICNEIAVFLIAGAIERAHPIA